MEIDIIQTIETLFTIVGAGVTVLSIIAPLTKATWDDKLLIGLKRLLNKVKLNKENQTIIIQVK